MSQRADATVSTTARLPGGTRAWVAVAVAVVTAGLVASVVRPLAPSLGPVPDPSTWFSDETLARIAAYQRPARTAGLLGVLLDVAVPAAIAWSVPGRRLVGRVVDAVGAGRPARASAAVAVVVVALTSVVRLPLGVWRHLHARAFGLSNQTLVGWAGDWCIEVAILGVSTAVVALIGFALIARWPERWVLFAAPVGLVLVAVTTLAAPLLVEPLRFDVTPLPDGATRRALTAVLDAEDRERAVLLVADASRRTTRQNAYVAGLAGTRRIVLYDTLLERPVPEIALIVAHELAHERHRDLLRGVLAGGAGFTLLAGVVYLVLRWRVRRGDQPHVADPYAAGVVVAVVVIATTVSTPAATWISRRAEAAADLGSLQLTGEVDAFCGVQQGLVERNLSDPAPPTWARVWWWTHPPAASRLELPSRVAGEPCPPR